jgi:hypothetical protein
LLEAVLFAVSATLNVTPDGTVIRACSLTVAVSVVTWEVSGRTTVVCANALPTDSNRRTTMVPATETFLNISIL